MLTTLKKAPSAHKLAQLFSDTTLTKKAYLNALSSMLDYAARLVIGFLLTPLLVGVLGDYLYGIWKILTSVTGYLTAASGRPTQTLKFTLAALQTSTDYAEKRRQVGSALLVWLLFCPLLFTLGGLMIWLIPNWLQVAAQDVWMVRVTAALLVLQMTLLSLVEIPHAILEGENIGYKRMGLSTLFVLFGGAGTALALYLHTGIVGAAVATVLSTIVSGFFFLRVAKSYVHWLGIAKPSWRALGHFTGLSWWFLVWRLVMQLMMASDSVLLGFFASVELVTSYSLTKYLPETLVSLIAIVVFGIAPGLGGLIGAGELGKAARVRGEIQLFTWFAATVIGSLTLLWNDDFLKLWVGANYHAGRLENLLLIIMMMQFVLIRNDGNFIDLTLNPRKKVLLGVVSVVLSTGGAVGLMQLFTSPMVGLCLGIIVGRLLLTVAYPFLIGQILQISLWEQIKGVARPALVSAILFVMTTRPEIILPQGSRLLVGGWGELLLGGFTSLVVIALFAFYSGMTATQRTQTLNRLQRMLALSS